MSRTACPRCKREFCVTLREIARIDDASLLERWLMRRNVHRIVIAYLLECVMCGTRFVHSQDGAEELPIGPVRSEPEAQGDKPRQARPSPPAWKQAPPL